MLKVGTVSLEVVSIYAAYADRFLVQCHHCTKRILQPCQLRLLLFTQDVQAYDASLRLGGHRGLQRSTSCLFPMETLGCDEERLRVSSLVLVN